MPAAKTWNYAHKLAIQHCLYTNMWTHKYLLFVDPDEILISRDGLSWPKLLKQLESKVEQHNDNSTDVKIAGYCFSSVFYPPQFGHSLVSMASVERDATTDYSRTKCIVRPEYVSDMGLYGTDQTIPSHMHTFRVPVDLAIIHHYQHCDGESSAETNCTQLVEDTSALKYQQELLTRYKHVQTQLSRTHMPEAVTL